MQYKTITLELLHHYHLPMTIQSLDRYSEDLRLRHLELQQALLAANPGNSQAASQALELAVAELEEHLRAEAFQENQATA